jgi:hypothetical protein
MPCRGAGSEIHPTGQQTLEVSMRMVVMTGRSLVVAAGLAAAVLACGAVRADEPTVLKEWDFVDGVQGWTGNNMTPLRTKGNALVFESTTAGEGE